MLTQLKERNLPLFSSVFIHANFFQEFGAEAYRVAARTNYNALFINPEAVSWSSPTDTAVRLHWVKFWSTPHPLHPLYHEAGHLFVSQIGEPQKLSPRQVTVAEGVSLRAKDSTEEFVSEVFAGLMSGVDYDKDILGLYKRLGGKRP